MDNRKRKTMKFKRIMPLAAFVLVGSITLAGCTSGDAESNVEAPKVPAVAVQDEKKDVTSPELAFGSSAEITATPSWTEAETIPAEWKQVPIDDAAKEDAERQGYEILSQPFFNTDETAEVFSEVGYIPSSATNRGELYLSQDYLYSGFDGYASAVTVSEPQVVRINTKDGTVDAFGVYFEGKDISPFQGDVKGFKIVRVFDTEVDTGMTPVPTEELADPSMATDVTKGLPVLSVTYIAQAGSFKNIEEDGSPLQLFVADVK